MDTIEKIRQLINETATIKGKNMKGSGDDKTETPYNLNDDVDKFYSKGNGAAGTRIRAVMQELVKLAKEVRKEVSEKKS